MVCEYFVFGGINTIVCEVISAKNVQYIDKDHAAARRWRDVKYIAITQRNSQRFRYLRSEIYCRLYDKYLWYYKIQSL